MPCWALRIRQTWLRATTVLVLATAIVLMLGFSVAPNLHERLHPTGGSIHECAVWLWWRGGCHYNAAPPLMIAPAMALHLSKIPALSPQWVQSPFLGAHAFSSTRRLHTPEALILFALSG